jgi:hypothetical protein
MSIINREVRNEWKTKLEPHLQAESPQDVVIRIAGAQGLGTRECPQTRSELDAILSRAEEACNDVLRPVVVDDTDPDEIIADLLETLEAQLDEALEQQQADASTDVPPLEAQLNKSRAAILSESVESFQLIVSRNVLNELRYLDDPDIERETVEALVENLDHQRGLIRRAAARALSEVAKTEPNWLSEHLDELVAATADESAANGSFYTLLWFVEHGDPCSDQLRQVTRAAGQGIRSDTTDSRHTAMDILQRVGKQAPETIVPSTVDILLDTQMSPDPVLGGKAEFIIHTLKEDVGLEQHEYDAEEPSKRSPNRRRSPSKRPPLVPNVHFDAEPSAGMVHQQWLGDPSGDENDLEDRYDGDSRGIPEVDQALMDRHSIHLQR